MDIDNVYTNNLNDSENFEEIKNLTHASKKKRLNFIKKVYGILLSQVFFTCLMIYFSIFSPIYKKFYINHYYLILLAFLTSIIILITIIYTNYGKIVPYNYLLLFLFTFCEGYLLSFVGLYKKDIIITAAILTLSITIGLSIYAFTTKNDITLQGGFFYLLFAVLIGLSILEFFFKAKWFEVLICIFGAFFYGVYIIYDTQLILGTKAAYLSIDDYIIASMMLYIDIFGLFIEVLRLLNALSE